MPRHVKEKKGTIAIDGPAGAGKSTVAKLVAQKLGYLYIDTGAMYRALTLKALRLKVPLNDFRRLQELAEGTEITLSPTADGYKVFLDGEDVTDLIRRPEVSAAVSEVSTVPGVRLAMVALQRKLAASGGVVMDGRDIGTYVLPSADLKIFLTASLQERARRRWLELQQKGFDLSPSDVEADLAKRDQIDAQRKVAPLSQAPDAVYIDSSYMTVEQVVNRITDEWHKLDN